MKYHFLEVAPFSAKALSAAVAPFAEGGWRVERVDLIAPATAKKPSYGLVTLTHNAEALASAAASATAEKNRRRPGHKLIDLGELDWGEHPDVRHLELDVAQKRRRRS